LLRFVYSMLPVSLDCPFFNAPSVFSKLYFISKHILDDTSGVSPWGGGYK